MQVSDYIYSHNINFDYAVFTYLKNTVFFSFPEKELFWTYEASARQQKCGDNFYTIASTKAFCLSF